MFSWGYETSYPANIGVLKVEKSLRYADTIQEIKDELQFSEEAENILNEQGIFSVNFRGKNHLDFFPFLFKGEYENFSVNM